MYNERGTFAGEKRNATELQKIQAMANWSTKKIIITGIDEISQP